MDMTTWEPVQRTGLLLGIAALATWMVNQALIAVIGLAMVSVCY